MAEEVLEAEVVSEETTFVPALPTRMLGWCNDANDVRTPFEQKASLHDGCPGILNPMVYNDPARKGSTFTSPGVRCSCGCHNRPVL